MPPTVKNVELVSSFEPLSQGEVGENQIGDVAVFKGHAFLQSGENCAAGKGGFYVIDVRNPASPAERAFVPALSSSYHGDGAHAITLSTAAFQGDVLAVNNESCSGLIRVGGGFDLYDVSNPAAPTALAQGFGDFGVEGSLTGTDTKANDAESIFIWQDGGNAYAAVVDNEELHSLDIFDITNPRVPQPVREYNLLALAPEAFTDGANAANEFLNDVVVKNIGGHHRLLAAYRDGGYIQLDASDPADLVFEADSDFGGTDPLTGFNPPEGNAHQAEYTYDNSMVATAEDDVAPHRVEHIDIDNVGRRGAATVPNGGVGPSVLADGVMNGPAAYVGYACEGSAPVPMPADVGMPAKDPGEEWIAVVQRGPVSDPDEDYNSDGNITNDGCFPGEKAANADEAGWDAVLIVNRHTPDNAAGDGVFCGSGAFPPGSQIVTVCTTHAAFHELFDDAVQYTIPYDDDVEGPSIGTQAPNKITVQALFDGWGYMSLYSTTPDEHGKFPLLDAHAIKEALNPAYAFGFGSLSISEQAADPTEPLSYASYNSGGLRVFSFEALKITEQGAFIGQEGNDFWGIEAFTTADGQRLVAASDRDHGLYVLRYTGPLAAQRPACTGATVSVPYRGSTTVPLVCTDANAQNLLTRAVVAGPAQGSLGPINQQAQTVTYTHSGSGPATDSFIFKGNDGAADSALATVQLQIGAPPIQCKVPALRGKTLAAARRALTRANCALGTVRRAYSAKVRRGRVIKQSRPAGRILVTGAKIGVTISRGPR